MIVALLQIEPKEYSFQPFERKKFSITFDPRFYKIQTLETQEFKGVLTGCVKLEPVYEKNPGLWYRPCGLNFLSEILEFNAVLESPLIVFKILKGDLQFFVRFSEPVPKLYFSTFLKFGLGMFFFFSLFRSMQMM